MSDMPPIVKYDEENKAISGYSMDILAIIAKHFGFDYKATFESGTL